MLALGSFLFGLVFGNLMGLITRYSSRFVLVLVRVCALLAGAALVFVYQEAEGTGVYLIGALLGLGLQGHFGLSSRRLSHGS